MSSSSPASKTFVCRSCAQDFPALPRMSFTGMPALAQHLPAAPQQDQGVDFALLQCPFCGLLQLDCPPVPYYREVLRAAAVSPEMTRFRRRQFRSFLRRHNLLGKKILECGCGSGEYLSIMRECGGNAFGWEFHPGNVANCRRLGLPVEQGFFATGQERLTEAPFQAFFCLNFLEHIPDLSAFLAGIRENLSADACGLLEVPNFEMMLRQNTIAEFMRDHLCYFTRETLSGLLQRNGFLVQRTRELFHGYFLSVEVIRRQPCDFSGFQRARDTLCASLRALVQQHGAAKTVVWGASHQTFALLAMASLPEPLLAIIDSSPLKQGRYSPVTNIPIVAPEQIHPGDCSLLIAAAGGYSEEVARLARERFGPTLTIYLLRPDGLAEHPPVTASP